MASETQCVVAGQRDAEEAELHHVAGDDLGGVDVREILEAHRHADAGAGGRAGPEAPFDAGMVGRPYRCPRRRWRWRWPWRCRQTSAAAGGSRGSGSAPAAAGPSNRRGAARGRVRRAPARRTAASPRHRQWWRAPGRRRSSRARRGRLAVRLLGTMRLRCRMRAIFSGVAGKSTYAGSRGRHSPPQSPAGPFRPSVCHDGAGIVAAHVPCRSRRRRRRHRAAAGWLRRRSHRGRP